MCEPRNPIKFFFENMLKILLAESAGKSNYLQRIVN